MLLYYSALLLITRPLHLSLANTSFIRFPTSLLSSQQYINLKTYHHFWSSPSLRLLWGPISPYHSQPLQLRAGMWLAFILFSCRVFYSSLLLRSYSWVLGVFGELYYYRHLLQYVHSNQGGNEKGTSAERFLRFLRNCRIQFQRYLNVQIAYWQSIY